MKCPRCQAHLEEALDVCGKCGFCQEAIEAILGPDQVSLGRLTDRAHCLRLMDSRRLEAQLEGFARKFPQVFVGVYFGELPPGVTMSELTFWLINHAYLEGDESCSGNHRAVVMVIDPVARKVGLNVGYALESVLPEKWLDTLLRNLRTPLWHGEYVNAVELVLHKLDRRLRKAAQKIVVDHEISPPEGGESFMQDKDFLDARAGEEVENRKEIL